LKVFFVFICVTATALMLFAPCKVKAQIFPKEGGILNYRLVGFRLGDNLPGKYTLEIAAGKDTTEATFDKHLIRSMAVKGPKVIAEVPAFGSQYTWRSICEGKGGKNIKSALHHFSTGYCPQADTSKYRLRVTIPAHTYKDSYVFLDGNRALYDMKGRPVWYLPDNIGLPGVPNDLKISSSGTITFLLNQEAYEINYNADILWKAPNDSAISGESHDFYHKNVLWSALAERKDAPGKEWEIVPQYRAGITYDQKAIKRLIWDK
jgi:hypothetical protein